VIRGRKVLGDGVRSPDLAHDRQLVTIELTCQVAADRLPGVATVVAAEDAVGGEVETCVRVWADEQWRVPVPAQRRLALAWLRLDVDLLPGAAIEADQPG